MSTTGLLPSLAGRSSPIRLSSLLVTPGGVSYNPREQALWFGLVPFRSPLLGKSHLLSSPPGTEMFQFPGSTSDHLCIQWPVLSHDGQRVSPFGNLRIKAYLRLPEAYRCLSRPSSAPSTKASTVRPSFLHYYRCEKTFISNEIKIDVGLDQYQTILSNVSYPVFKVQQRE